MTTVTSVICDSYRTLASPPQDSNIPECKELSVSPQLYH